VRTISATESEEGVSEEIREFDWMAERRRRQKHCASCGNGIREGYVYYDKFSLTYCADCYLSYADLASRLKEDKSG
jgi:hypothetical protein